MREAPEVIYLQWADGESYDDNTWCQDQINDDDIEYVKVSTATRRLELLMDIDEKCAFCPCCMSHKISTVGEKVHADGCELAKELENA